MGQTHVTSGSTPLGELVLYERQRRGLTRRELAALVRRADRTLRTNEKAIERWELRGHVPQPPALRALAAVLEKPVEHLVALARQRPDEPMGAALDMPPTAPADHEYVEAIHATIRHLVGLEVQHGGDDVAPLALRSFQESRRRLALGGHPRELDRDLTAAAGELAEVAAWLLHDADQQETARQLNIEALHLTRLAGDRSIELLTMSNMAFQSLFLRQPGEALLLARSALADDHLTNRQRVIFQLREARALAQLGARSDALRLAAEASSAFEDGATREDPEWSWWVWPSEVAGHAAWTRLEVGDDRGAVKALQRTVEAFPLRHPNNRFFWLARFLGAALEASAWSDAETVIDQILPVVGEVRSGRSVRLLQAGIQHLATASTPPRVVDAGTHLAEVMSAAGYDALRAGPASGQ